MDEDSYSGGDEDDDESLVPSFDTDGTVCPNPDPPERAWSCLRCWELWRARYSPVAGEVGSGPSSSSSASEAAGVAGAVQVSVCTLVAVRE